MNAEELATQIAATYGMRPQRHGREWRVCCGVHEADGGVHRPSLAVWDSAPGRYAVKCMTGCSRDSVYRALRERGVAVGRQAKLTTAQQLAAARANEERRQMQLMKAREMLIEHSHATVDGDPVDRYLRSRRIDPLLVRSAVPSTIRCGRDDRGVCMVSPVMDLTTVRDSCRVTGVATLALRDDGTPFLGPDGKKLRSITGTYAGYAVPLGNPHNPQMVVGEGIETTLSAMMLLNVPFGAAVLSASNMPGLALPEWITELHIAVDNDDAGRFAATQLSGLFREITGRYATQHQWGATPGWDANDELMTHGIE